MKLSALIRLYNSLEGMNTFRRNSTQSIYLEGLQGSSIALFFAAWASENKSPALFVLNDEEEAEYFYSDLKTLLTSKRVLFFPSPYKGALKFRKHDVSLSIMRNDVLRRILSPTGLIIVTYPEALAISAPNKEQIETQSILLKVGDSIGLTLLSHRLIQIGMKRVDYVYTPGEFSVRGSILDVFSYTSQVPYRIDFFGDEIDTIRTFDISSQLSQQQLSQVSILPEMTENETHLHVSLLSFFPHESLLVWKDRQFCCDRIQGLFDEGFLNDGETSHTHQPEKLLLKPSVFLKDLLPFHHVYLRPTPQADLTITFHILQQPLFHKNFDLLVHSLSSWQQQGYTIYILSDSPRQTQRLSDIFTEMQPPVNFTPITTTLHAGFIDENLRICVLTDHQIFDRFHRSATRNSAAEEGRVSVALKDLLQFHPGDYVVHTDHGIGLFQGLVQIEQGGKQQEVMKLLYHSGSIVYVSIHSLGKVSKYKGKDSEAPTLSKLGTGAWEKLKAGTRRKIKDIARDLIKLYAERKQMTSFAFSSDTYLQHELEASFLYEDTPDQLKVTAEVKHDMESSRPMDRLVCGDVGFGKTEIAVRAAFKAATDGKQVAILVPTTILAYQHYHTFSRRLKDFPVHVDYLSRTRSAAQIKKIKEELRTGLLEIIIGTHKLLSSTIKFHDLGLLIIDEEQKFGVAVKEKLRQMRTNIDTLTLSATPIPRTLQFSLMGARDLSVIQTPPPNRHPIRTEIHPFSHEIICEAINFEMTRGGQTFFVSGRISRLTELERLILKYIPDCRIAIGHGQMPADQLEHILLDFIQGKYDVLISTTIMENGIDIPNANTILIDGAHHFGLSDLHQMRGRIGRADRKAFCYLLAPPLSLLSDESRRRLEALENFSFLGSGIQVAMQDLDIRGAGNLLGAEQSGFIANLGYETYQKILTEAVTELKNEEFSDLYAEEAKQEDGLKGDLFVQECTLETDLSLYFSPSYIPSSTERMSLYRQLDNLPSPADLTLFQENLEDRFGPIPQEGKDLIQAIHLRHIARSLGIERIVLKQGRMILCFVSNPNSAFYQSPTFLLSLNYLKNHFHTTTLTEQGGRRRIIIQHTSTISKAFNTLQEITQIKQA